MSEDTHLVLAFLDNNLWSSATVVRSEMNLQPIVLLQNCQNEIWDLTDIACPLCVISGHLQRTSRCPLSANSGHGTLGLKWKRPPTEAASQT